MLNLRLALLNLSQLLLYISLHRLAADYRVNGPGRTIQNALICQPRYRDQLQHRVKIAEGRKPIHSGHKHILVNLLR